MELYRQDDRIEGARCELYCRKPTVKNSMEEHPISGEPCIRAEMSRNATSEISKELELTDEEKKIKIEQHRIHTDLGDKLIADGISVYVCQKRPLKFKPNEGATHTHGGNFSTTHTTTLCEISYPHEHIRNAELRRIESQNDKTLNK